MRFLLSLIVCLLVFPIAGFAQTSDWINYTSGAQVTAFVDDGNYLWVGSYGGLTRLNKTTGDMVHYNSANSQLPDNMISSIAKDVNGDLWVGTDNGLGKFDGTNWTVYNSDNFPVWRSDITCLAIDAEGNKWIGVFMGGLVKFDGTNWTVYNTSNSGLPADDFRSMVIDADGNKWMATSGGGLVKFDGTNWTVYNTESSGLPSDHIGAVAIDINGDVWIGGSGLTRFDGTNWIVYTEDNSPLPSNTVRCIAIDTDGNKWVGTYKGFASVEICSGSIASLPCGGRGRDNSAGVCRKDDLHRKNGEDSGWPCGDSAPYRRDAGSDLRADRTVMESCRRAGGAHHRSDFRLPVRI